MGVREFIYPSKLLVFYKKTLEFLENPIPLAGAAAGKLRILIVCDIDDRPRHTRFLFHRAIAECLASDHKNVEQVVYTFSSGHAQCT